MEDREFNCPHCGQSLVADDSVAGVYINCPRCEGVLFVANETHFSSSHEEPPEEVRANSHVFIFDLRPSLRGFLVPMVLSLLLLPFYGLGLLLMGGVVLRAKSRHYQLTTEGLISSEGLLGRRTYMLEVNQIRSILMEQSALERLFNIGRVTVICTHAKLQLLAIPDPFQVKQTIVRTCRERRHRSSVSAEPVHSEGESAFAS